MGGGAARAWFNLICNAQPDRTRTERLSEAPVPCRPQAALRRDVFCAGVVLEWAPQGADAVHMRCTRRTRVALAGGATCVPRQGNRVHGNGRCAQLRHTYTPVYIFMFGVGLDSATNANLLERPRGRGYRGLPFPNPMRFGGVAQGDPAHWGGQLRAVEDGVRQAPRAGALGRMPQRRFTGHLPIHYHSPCHRHPVSVSFGCEHREGNSGTGGLDTPFRAVAGPFQKVRVRGGI